MFCIENQALSCKEKNIFSPPLTTQPHRASKLTFLYKEKPCLFCSESLVNLFLGWGAKSSVNHFSPLHIKASKKTFPQIHVRIFSHAQVIPLLVMPNGQYFYSGIHFWENFKIVTTLTNNR